MRVGGRLVHAGIPEEQKQPIILPSCRAAKLLIEYLHKRCLHGGLQVTLRLLRQHYWVFRARTLAKGCIRSCVTCFRQRATMSKQLMGSLPSVRVNPSRPFSHVGIDYAGPFLIRTASGRGNKSHKGYLLVFVCLAVRAIHLECANDYTSSGFLAAFDRFTARRGLPAHIYTDNGTNFVGASRELRDAFLEVTRDPSVQNHLATDMVEWHFIPPAAPHFGGLWEAGVKSVKHHLRRIMGNMTPTYEEFATLLARIEAVLNSRPIVPLHDDPDSLEVLAPGHFLVGSLLKSVPVASVLDVQENRLSRWQAVQKLFETFWRVWSLDYLNTLQQRSKWQDTRDNLSEGDLVLIKNPNLPPGKWDLGRITQVIPGDDGLVRVVTVKTLNSTYKRPITQLAKLPVDSRTP